MDDVLNTNHWNIENYKQVVSRKDAQDILRDRFHFVNGSMREFVVKSIGVGMYEVSKKERKNK